MIGGPIGLYKIGEAFIEKSSESFFETVNPELGMGVGAGMVAYVMLKILTCTYSRPLKLEKIAALDLRQKYNFE